jgi:hypothetical protein
MGKGKIEPVDLQDAFTSFLIIFVGLFVSLLALFYEIVWIYVVKQKVLKMKDKKNLNIEQLNNYLNTKQQ